MESWGWWGLSRETKNASPGTHLVFSTQWQHFILLETDCKTTIISEKVNLEGEFHLIRPHHLLTASFRGQDNLQLLCAFYSHIRGCSSRQWKQPSGYAEPDICPCTNPWWPSPSSFPPSNTPHFVIHTSSRLLARVDPCWKRAVPRIGLLRCWNGAKAQN